MKRYLAWIPEYESATQGAVIPTGKQLEIIVMEHVVTEGGSVKAIYYRKDTKIIGVDYIEGAKFVRHLE